MKCADNRPIDGLFKCGIIFTAICARVAPREVTNRPTAICHSSFFTFHFKKAAQAAFLIFRFFFSSVIIIYFGLHFLGYLAFDGHNDRIDHCIGYRINKITGFYIIGFGQPFDNVVVTVNGRTVFG